MSQKYQNEKSPIVYGVKKPKTLRKVQKMTVLQAWEIYKMFWNTRYNIIEYSIASFLLWEYFRAMVWSMVNVLMFELQNWMVRKCFTVSSHSSVWTSLNMLEPRHLIGWCSTNPEPELAGVFAAQQVVNMFEATAVCRAVSFIYYVWICLVSSE